jgi:hypothetical protein
LKNNEGKNTTTLKERLLKSKFNDKTSYVEAQPVSEDEGISKTPDSMKNYLNIQQQQQQQQQQNLNANITKVCCLLEKYSEIYFCFVIE